MPSHSDRDKRRTVFCQTTVDLKNWETGREKLVSCGIADTYIPTFYVPEEGPVIRVANNRPDGIVLVNLETQITCPEALPGSFGDPITIPYGLYFFNINYDDIPDITEDQLHFIASLDQDAINTALSSADFSVVTTLRLSVEQQEFLVNEVALGIEMLLVTTQNAARGILRCRYANDPKTVCCPDNFFVVDGELVNSCLTIAGGEFYSSKSKTDANFAVTNVTSNWLAQCVTGNDPNPNDPGEPDCPSGFINTNLNVDIPAGSFLGYTKNEANNKARLARKLLINCEICNDAIVISCPEESITEPFVIPAGEICADSSAELQELIAESVSLAETCEFENDRIDCSCKDIDATYDAESTGVFKSIVAAGLYTAESKTEANLIAKEECLADLECYWQNDCVQNCPIITKKNVNTTDADSCAEKVETSVIQPPGCAIPPGKFVSDVSKKAANEQAISERGQCPENEDCGPFSECLPEQYFVDNDIPIKGMPCKVVPVYDLQCAKDSEKTQVAEEFYYCGKRKKDDNTEDLPCPEDCECSTVDDALANYGKDKFEFCDPVQALPTPCGIQPADLEAKTPAKIKYCVRPVEVDQPEDIPCIGGCGCMTPDQASKNLFFPTICGEGALISCGVVLGDENLGIPDVYKYCFKEEFGNPDPGTDPGGPPDSDLGCPEGCVCGDFEQLQKQNPGKEIKPCEGKGAAPCGDANDLVNGQMKMCYKVEGSECADGCICSNYRALRTKYPDKTFETCNGQTTYCGGINPSFGDQINMCYKDPGAEPPTGGCPDGGTGSISIIKHGESVGTPLLEWVHGCTKTNGNIQLVVREIEICVDGYPVTLNFLTVGGISSPQPS